METQADTKLRGRWLAAARAAWLVIALLAVGLIALGTGPYWNDLGRVCLQEADYCESRNLLSPQIAEQFQQAGISLRFYAVYYLFFELLFKLFYAFIGLFLFLRKSDDWMALLASIFLITFGLVTFSAQIGQYGAMGHPAGQFLFRLLGFVGDFSILLFFLLFPGGRVTHRLFIIWGAFCTLVMFFQYFFPGSALDRQSMPAVPSITLFVLNVSLVVVAQVVRYRQASSLAQRVQTRWVVMGVAGAVSGLLLLSVSFYVFGFWQMPIPRMVGDTLIVLAMMLIPLSIAVAVLRYRLWDIDIFVRRTLLYSSLTILLALLYLSMVLLFQQVFGRFIGGDSQAGVVFSTLVVAALAHQIRERLQVWIDRRFYRQKYDAEKTLSHFLSSIRHEVDADQISRDVLTVVDQALQPDSTTLWLRAANTQATRKTGV